MKRAASGACAVAARVSGDFSTCEEAMMRRILIATAVGMVVLATVSGGAGAKTHRGVSALDASYLKTSIQGDRFEIEGGRLASASSNATVRALAARLVRDHTKSLSDAVKLAHHLGVDVPKAPTPPEKWELRMVAQLTGAAFDHWYSELEVADHHQDISEASDEAHNGTHAVVRANARHELPVLRRHLQLSIAAVRASG
jgi:putative membrane protein